MADRARSRSPCEPFRQDQRDQRQKDGESGKARDNCVAAWHLKRPVNRERQRPRSPGMFDTKVMVAPNSPSERAKPSTSEAQIPGRDKGTVMLVNVFQGPAPNVRAAPSRRRSTASIDSRIARTISGSAITAAAIAAPSSGR